MLNFAIKSNTWLASNFYLFFGSEAPLWTCLSISHSRKNYVVNLLSCKISVIELSLFEKKIYDKKLSLTLSVSHGCSLVYILAAIHRKMPNYRIYVLNHFKSSRFSLKCHLRKLKKYFVSYCRLYLFFQPIRFELLVHLLFWLSIWYVCVVFLCICLFPICKFLRS